MSQMESAILKSLHPGAREPYAVIDGSLPFLKRTLSRILDDGSGLQELTRTLELICALENELTSPRAAETIRNVLRGEPRALEIIRAEIIRYGAYEDVQAFLDREGRKIVLSAPMMEEPTPKDPIKLPDFLNPESSSRTRVPSTRQR